MRLSTLPDSVVTADQSCRTEMVNGLNEGLCRQLVGVPVSVRHQTAVVLPPVGRAVSPDERNCRHSLGLRHSPPSDSRISPAPPCTSETHTPPSVVLLYHSLIQLLEHAVCKDNI